MAGFSFHHKSWAPQLGTSSSFDAAFTLVGFNRGNSQRKASNILAHKETLIWNALPDSIFFEFKSFFEGRAKDGKSFLYRSPNDHKQRQWIVASDSGISYQGISSSQSSLTVQLEEVFDV